ncbi:MAG: FKBP-type peptidyl-prolyl cis-trans isomerase [Clostridiales bacterium]|nr:FKBP-type peptidyl-prolyl cis-trans isomerase [Clostridiales bacterium]
MAVFNALRGGARLKGRNILIGIIFLTMAAAFTGCGEKAEDNSLTNNSVVEESGENNGIAFSYSNGIDENGFWQDVTALDYVELYDYNSFAIPREVHSISDDAVQSELDAILEYYASSEQITDRAVVDGDTVNIDYVGSVDGVEFDGGSTGGAGTEVTIGVTSYIDNFLEQLIGHNPGETFDINVTFPEDYGQDNLNGKEAVFVTTINYISSPVKPELTDDFVADNLSAENGWITVSEARNGVYADLQKTAVQSYIQEYLVNSVAVKSVPNKLVEYQKNFMIDYYQGYADSYGMELEEFLSTFAGFASLEELLESSSEDNVQSAKYSLAIQAIAEDAKITVSAEDVALYFKEAMGTDDYSEYEESYGLPYLKQVVLGNSVMNYLVEHTVQE